MARDDWWAGWFRTEVPCAPSHRPWVHLQRLWIFVRTVVTGLGACAFAAFFLFPGFEGAARGWRSFVFAALCIGALVVWEQFHPPAFTVYVRADRVHYDFRDAAYAQEFAQLNLHPGQL